MLRAHIAEERRAHAVHGERARRGAAAGRPDPGAYAAELGQTGEPAAAGRHRDVLGAIGAIGGKLILRAHIIDGERTGEDNARMIEADERTLYMEAPLAAVRRPDDLIRAYAAELGKSGDPVLPVGTVMFMEQSARSAACARPATSR